MMESEGTDQPPMDAESPAESPETGYAIELKIYPDGRIVVSRESLEHETAEGEAPAAGQPGPTGQPSEAEETDQVEVTDFEDALLAAVKIYKANPIHASDAAQFDSGYQGAHGQQGIGMKGEM